MYVCIYIYIYIYIYIVAQVAGGVAAGFSYKARGHRERPHPQKSDAINIFDLNCSE